MTAIAGQVYRRLDALQTPQRLHAALAFGSLSLQVGAALGVPLSTRDRDDVQGAVDLAVAAAVQAVAVVSAKLSQINETRLSHIGETSQQLSN
jgi:hypothetical protein